MPRIGRKVPCPCGTGMTYGDCCLKRNIKWMVDENGEIYRSVVVSPEATEELKKFMEYQKVEFSKIFGRDPGPEDFIFFQDRYLGTAGDITKELVSIMKKVGIKPEFIYATKKTGLLPTEDNWDKLTTKDINDWREAIEEYHMKVELGESPIDDEDPHPIEEVQSLLELLPNCLLMLAHICEHRITPKKDPRDIVSLSSTVSIQFCLGKTELNMKAIAKLIEDSQHRAEALNLTRSLYENYLTIVYTRKQPQKMADIFDAKAGLRHGWYEYCINKKGEIDRKRAKEKATGKEVSLEISKKEMAKSSDYEEDIEIYTYLYGFLFGYTHTDLGIMFDYMLEAEKDESGKNDYSEFLSEAIVFPLLIVVMILDETRKTNIINEETKADATRFLKKIIPNLIAFFKRRSLTHDGKDYSEIINSRLNKIDII